MIVKLVVKKQINGKFVEVASYDTDDIKQIKYNTNGFEITVYQLCSRLYTDKYVYDNQCVIEFKTLYKEERHYTTPL